MIWPKRLLGVYGNRRVWLLVALGFASGLPFNLVFSTLAAWMTNAGVNLKTIGLFALVTTPYSLKFLWSPLVDRYSPGFLGRRRGWIALTQLCLGATFVAMGFCSPEKAPFLLACLAATAAFFSASQDIASDAYRTDLLPEPERAAGTATFILGYRVAMLVSGGLALILSDLLGWHSVYRLMAPLMAVGLIATFLAEEPKNESPPHTLTDAVVRPFADFFGRRGALLALLFLVLYRAGEAIGGSMLTPFLIKTGFTNTQIGTVNKVWGLVATVAGALIAGGTLGRLGLRRGLLIFGLLQAATNAAYMALAVIGKSLPFLIVAIAVHNLCSGLADAAQVAFQMSLCKRAYSATQYALLSSLAAVARSAIGAGSGYLAVSVGWVGFFGVAIAAGLPGLLLLLAMPEGMAIPPAEDIEAHATVEPDVA